MANKCLSPYWAFSVAALILSAPSHPLLQKQNVATAVDIWTKCNYARGEARNCRPWFTQNFLWPAKSIISVPFSGNIIHFLCVQCNVEFRNVKERTRCQTLSFQRSFGSMIPKKILFLWFLMKFCLCNSWWRFINMIPDEVLLVWFLMKFCLRDSCWSLISMIRDDAFRSPSFTLCIITQVPTMPCTRHRSCNYSYTICGCQLLRSVFWRLYSNSQVEYRLIPNPYPRNIHEDIPTLFNTI